jgi:DNA-binding transcriptional regulator PaaX
VLGEGRDRIFSFGQQASWAGTWTLLMYTIPEQKRALRHDLRKRLRFLGFSTLHAATWVAPRDRTSDVRGLLDELTARSTLTFSSAFRPALAASITAACCDLARRGCVIRGLGRSSLGRCWM